MATINKHVAKKFWFSLKTWLLQLERSRDLQGHDPETPPESKQVWNHLSKQEKLLPPFPETLSDCLRPSLSEDGGADRSESAGVNEGMGLQDYRAPFLDEVKLNHRLSPSAFTEGVSGHEGVQSQSILLNPASRQVTCWGTKTLSGIKFEGQSGKTRGHRLFSFSILLSFVFFLLLLIPTLPIMTLCSASDIWRGPGVRWMSL